jgi:hypothetical protein
MGFVSFFRSSMSFPSLRVRCFFSFLFFSFSLCGCLFFFDGHDTRAIQLERIKRRGGSGVLSGALAELLLYNIAITIRTDRPTSRFFGESNSCMSPHHRRNIW